jgi:phosphoserine aminotransferase
MLPPSVLQRAREDIPDWQGLGTSVMEVSHRGAPFMNLAQASELRLRRLAGIPSHYKVLFLQSGASNQFALLPMNLSEPEQAIGFVQSGHWARKARSEASLSRECRVLADFDPSVGPGADDAPSGNGCAYLHLTANETVDGFEFPDDPQSAAAPVVCDMSSSILSRPMDVERYGVIYAGAQKNIGPAGLTIVIIREDLLDRCPSKLPTMLSYRKMAQGQSMANTPPTFAWYMADLVFQWIEALGGLQAMAARNRTKSQRLYQYIDDSGIYRARVTPPWRSRMNVTFDLMDDSLQDRFLAEANEAGLYGLKGHRAVGGLRASLYNAMPLGGVDALIEFMDDFEQRCG